MDNEIPVIVFALKEPENIVRARNGRKNRHGGYKIKEDTKMAKGYEEFESKMKKTVELLSTSFASVRAGRANAAVLDQIQVDYYGTPTPIQQIATISTPDPRSLLIQPLGRLHAQEHREGHTGPATWASTRRTTGAA